MASIGARLDIPYDRIDELRMVVDEASAQLLSARAAQTLTMRVTPGDRLVIQVASDAAPNGAWPPPGLEDTLAWRVLSGLADDVRFELTADGPTVRIEMEARS